MSAKTLPLFEEMARPPPCSLCRSPGFRRGCARCDGRWRLFRPRSEAELAADATASAGLCAQLEAVEAEEGARLERLLALGRPVRVFVVGCGKAKAAAPRAARDLYLGSLFRAGRRFAESAADEWFIASALHGLVLPTEEIAPYERRLGALSRAERAGWGGRVAGSLERRYRHLPVALTVLAGSDYVRWISRALPAGWTVATPLAGLGLGARLQWLRLHSAQVAQESFDGAA